MTMTETTQPLDPQAFEHMIGTVRTDSLSGLRYRVDGVKYKGSSRFHSASVTVHGRVIESNPGILGEHSTTYGAYASEIFYTNPIEETAEETVAPAPADKRPAPKTTWGTIARVLRDFGLKQGRTEDFRVSGEYKNGERQYTYVILSSLVTGSEAQNVIFENADAIEEATAAYGMPFYVSVKYFSNGKRFVSVDNHRSGHIREEAPANAYVRVPGDLTPASAEDTAADIASDDMLTVCADGRVREIARTTYRNGEPERIVCTDGTEWDTARCSKPLASHPVPDTPVQPTPIERAATMTQALGAEHSVRYLRMALQPYFLDARCDALTEALTALSGIQDKHARDVAVRIVRGLKDGTYQ